MTAIDSSNIIKKLAFATQGGAQKRHLDALRTELVAQTNGDRDAGLPTPSRNMVYKWFQGSQPKNEASLTFFFRFANRIRKDEITFVRLSKDQKKVIGQVSRFCQERRQKDQKSKPVHGLADGSVVIRQDRIFSPTEISENVEYFVGVYNIYRMKFAQKSNYGDIATEVVCIYKVGSQLYASWWFLIDGEKLQKFHGAVVFVGAQVWIILHNASLGGRMRTLCIDRLGWGRVPNGYYTGLLMSASPDFKSPAPVACRVVFEKVKNPSKKSQLKNFVHFSSLDEFDHPQKSDIIKLIENATTQTGILNARTDQIGDLQTGHSTKP
ncbi:MAG: hypothetical protein KUG74_10735 [Rhodobacteraceae bacterium]|nr:hypothetical protein [Paracoccaceae bacterium]